MSDSMNILDLPDIVLENVLSFLTYDEIAKNRLVCKKFDSSCKSLLNRGFVVVERRQSLVSRNIRHCLPRRESERRAHPLARHCEILSALETRISMLSMTFMKFIDTGLCCFIPGKVIDEILHILRVVQKSSSPPRTHDLLQELRDISSMAMEHFEEYIVPSLRLADANNTPVNKSVFQSTGLKRTGRRSPILVSDLIRREFKTINNNTKMYRQQLCGMKKLVYKLNQKVKSQDSLLQFQACKLRKQRRLIQEQSNSISDMKKHLEECDRKISDLTTEFNQTRDKPTDTKASQTNEDNKPMSVSQQITANLLKDLNCSLPSFINNLTRLPPLPSFKNPFNIDSFKEAEDILHNVDDDDYRNPREFFSKSFHSYPSRRTTLSDFRSNYAAVNKQKGDDNNDKEVNSRKRKVIDLIANVVDSKTPIQPIDKAEFTQLLRKHPRLHDYSPSFYSNGDEDGTINLTEKIKGKRRLQRYSDVTDEIPTKRLLGKFRPM